MGNKVYGNGGASMDDARKKIETAVKNRKVIRQEGATGRSIFDGNPKYQESEDDSGTASGEEDDESGLSSPTSDGDGRPEASPDDADDTPDIPQSKTQTPPPAPQSGGGEIDQDVLREVVREEVAALTPDMNDIDRDEGGLPKWAQLLKEKFDHEQLEALTTVTPEMLAMLGGRPVEITWHYEKHNVTGTFDVVEFLYHSQGDHVARVTLKARPDRQFLVPDPGQALYCTIAGVSYRVKMAQAREGQKDVLGWNKAMMIAVEIDNEGPGQVPQRATQQRQPNVSGETRIIS